MFCSGHIHNSITNEFCVVHATCESKTESPSQNMKFFISSWVDNIQFFIRLQYYIWLFGYKYQILMVIYLREHLSITI